MRCSEIATVTRALGPSLAGAAVLAGLAVLAGATALAGLAALVQVGQRPHRSL